MRKEFRVFELDTGSVSLSTSFKLNCHECGKTFAPLKVYMCPRDRKEYYLGTYCRLSLIIFLDDVKFCNCLQKKFRSSYVEINGEVVERPYIYTWVYDSKDDMEGKIHNDIR